MAARGSSTINFTSASSAITVNLTSGTATGWGTDALTNFSNVVGSNQGRYHYWCGRVTTVSWVVRGNDYVYATTGADTLNGGGGVNTIDFSNANLSSVIDLNQGLSTGWASDTLSNFTKIIGSNSGDTITGSVGNDTITAGTGNDVVYASTGSDSLQGGAGVNTLNFSNATSGSNINLATGLTTGYASDQISNFTKVVGSNNNDTIIGGTASDTIIGGSGADNITGGAGSDSISAGWRQ